MPVLFKAKGKCTTDHISKAGSWLKFRGHLGEISKNTYLGVYNSFYNLIGQGVNPISKDRKIKELPNIAYSLRKQNISWAVVGDENFGEGSSREHAAMQPRYLGCKVIIVKSFARIHETNLKKHGILPLTFNDIIDYDKFKNNDRVTILNVDNIASDQLINVMLIHENNAQEIIKCKHSLSSKQIKWLKSGSALNYIALKNKKM